MNESGSELRQKLKVALATNRAATKAAIVASKKAVSTKVTTRAALAASNKAAAVLIAALAANKVANDALERAKDAYSKAKLRP